MKYDGNLAAILTEGVVVISRVGKHVTCRYLTGEPIHHSILFVFIVLHAMWDSVLGFITYLPSNHNFSCLLFYSSDMLSGNRTSRMDNASNQQPFAFSRTLWYAVRFTPRSHTAS